MRGDEVLIKDPGICAICGDRLMKLLTTPVLRLDDGYYGECCERCADANFPGWDEEDSITDDEE